MDELELLTGQEPMELDALLDPVETAPIGNTASNKNLAAHVAYVDGTDPVGMYRQITGEMSADGMSLQAQQLIEASRDANVKRSREALSDFLVSPDIDDYTKADVASDFLDVQSARYNIRNTASEVALSEEEVENAEQEIVRLDAGAWINEVNQVKRADQALFNAEVAKNDTETLTAYMDIVQYLSPFMESTMISKLVKDFREGLDTGEDVSGIAWDAILLTGSAKDEVVQALKSLPPQQRHEVKQQLAKIISRSSSIVMADDNDFARTEMLRTFVGEDYDNVDKWVDNTVSILDATVLGGPLVRLLRGAKKAPVTGPVEPSVGTLPDVKADATEPVIGSLPVEEAITQKGLMRPIRPIKGRALPKTLAAKYKAEGFDSRLDTRRQVRTAVQPVSLANNVKDFSPKRAADMHAAVVMDQTGEMADALYGTSRTEAIANDLAPEIGRSDGIIENKVGKMAEMSSPLFEMADDLKRFQASRGVTYFSDAEKSAARGVAWTDFQNAKGLSIRGEMSAIRDTDTGAKFTAVFGPENGGYRNAQDAVELTAYALRSYGVTHKDITLLKRTPEGYKEVKANNLDATQDGDYLVKVDYDWQVKPLDVTAPEQWTIKRNLFDRFATSMSLHKSIGTLTRNLLDPASILDPRMVKSAFAAVDKSSRLEQALLERGEDFAQAFEVLPKDRRQVVYDFFKEANHKGIKHDVVSLKANGFTDKEIDVVGKWRNAWDQIYWLENEDVARTLTNRGYMLLTDRKGSINLIGRPVAKNQKTSIPVGENLYDPVTDTVIPSVQSDVTKLYDKGGVVVRLRTPITVNGERVFYTISPEKQGTAYMRAIGKYDQVLPYRDGYYKVNYTAPHFIVERVKDAKGNVLYTRAVSIAGTKADALVEAKRLARTSGKTFDDADNNADYFIRGDVKGEARLDMEFEVAHMSGRSSQRFRGERLQEANSPNHVGADHSYIMSPAEALIHASRNISRRAPMREWLEAMKDRFAKQYGHLLPKDEYKRARYPSSLDQIVKAGRGTDKDVADARTAWSYIDEMESGYINAIDDGYKAMLNGIADALGNKGLAKAERGVRILAEGRGPTEFSKNVAFHAYIVGHPLRQAVIQAHQAVVYFPMNPSYASARMPLDALGALAHTTGLPIEAAAKMAKRDVKEFTAYIKDLQDAGLIASIDKQNLVRSSLSSMADELNNLPVFKQTHMLMTKLRQIGFDAGETYNMASVFGVFRDLAIQEGKTLTPAVLEEIAAKARNYSLGMNRAGDMPYNQNALGMLFQFLQVPHKMSTLMTTNRILSRKERLQLAAYVLPMWTLPTAAMYTILDKTGTLPENKEARDLVVQGVEGYLYNKAIQSMTGSDTKVDFSSLGPFDAFGLYEFVHEMVTSPAGEILSKTPSGTLFFGHNPRVTDAFRTMAGWVHGQDQFSNEKELADVVRASASIFSGMDSAFKAAYIFEHGKKLSYSGAETTGLDNIAGVAQLFGFQTIEEAERAYLKNRLFKDKQSLKDNVTEYYNGMKRSLADESISNADRMFVQKVLRSGMAVMKKEYGIEASKMLYDMMERDIKNNDSMLYKRLMETSGWRTNEQIRQDLERIKDWEPEKKAKLFDQLDGIERVEEIK